jgi:hypothetical protein
MACGLGAPAIFRTAASFPAAKGATFAACVVGSVRKSDGLLSTPGAQWRERRLQRLQPRLETPPRLQAVAIDGLAYLI